MDLLLAYFLKGSHGNSPQTVWLRWSMEHTQLKDNESINFHTTISTVTDVLSINAEPKTSFN